MLLFSRKTILYRTGQFRQNIPFRHLNRYRNRPESYCPKHRGVPACFGYFSEFWSFSMVFLFRTGTNIIGFFWKNIILTATSDHHWSINLLDHQQHHFLLRFSHLDLLFSHCNRSLLHLLSPCFVCSACWNSFSTFLRSFVCLNVLKFTLMYCCNYFSWFLRQTFPKAKWLSLVLISCIFCSFNYFLFFI